MYKIKIRHGILIECHGNYLEMKKVKLYALDFKKFLTIFFGCPEGCFLRVWLSKKTPRHPAGQDHEYKNLDGCKLILCCLRPGIFFNFLARNLPVNNAKKISP